MGHTKLSFSLREHVLGAPSAALTMALVLTLNAFGAACTSSKPPQAPTITQKGASTSTGTLPTSSEDDLNREEEEEEEEDTNAISEIDLTPRCDPSDDFAMLSYPKKIKDCLKSDKIYDFDVDTCTTMHRALFECTYPAVTSELEDIGIPSANLDVEKSAGRKLISCGASNDGLTIVTQHWQATSAQTGTCDYSATAGKVISLCFRHFPEGGPASPPKTAAEKRQYLKECMQE